MTGAEILTLAQERGVVVRAGPSGKLRWSCKNPPPDDLPDLLRLLVCHKPALLAALLSASWDQGEAERLLSEAQVILSHVEAECCAGRVTSARRNAAQIWMEVAEQYVRNHELEAKRNWNAMELLRSVVKRMETFSVASKNIPPRRS